ncbi:MAG: hypothetical protein WA777_01705 [Rhodanobacter sp.]
MTSEPLVTMAHVRACGFCAKGVREFFSQYDGLDLNQFCREGLPASVIEATGDALALAAAAKAREGDGHGR